MIHLAGAFMAQALAVRPEYLSLTKAGPSPANPHDQMNRYGPAGCNFLSATCLKGVRDAETPASIRERMNRLL